MSTAFSREHRIKLSSFWEEKKKTINEVANNTKGITDRFPSPPCGGFHLQEN